MSRIKMFVKKYLPKSFLYRYKYYVETKNIKKTYLEAEEEISEQFEKIFGRKIDWDNPTSYNEKINVAKLYGAEPLKTKLTDKILVSDWVRKNVGEDECKIIPLIAIYDSVDEINFSQLPERYVMKMNNDSGSVFICDEKHQITKDVIAKYKYYFEKRNYAYKDFEMQYRNIKPKIMIEEYMGDAIRDYKFQCFDGKVVSCRVDFDRFGKHTRNFYDKNWELLPFNKGSFKNYPEPVEKPKNYEKMWKLAERLSSGFDQVRVDFYDIDDVIYFGEMTFTNGSGFEEFHPDKIDFMMGEMWELNMRSIKRRRGKLFLEGLMVSDGDNKRGII